MSFTINEFICNFINMELPKQGISITEDQWGIILEELTDFQGRLAEFYRNNAKIKGVALSLVSNPEGFAEKIEFSYTIDGSRVETSYYYLSYRLTLLGIKTYPESYPFAKTYESILEQIIRAESLAGVAGLDFKYEVVVNLDFESKTYKTEVKLLNGK